MVIPIEDEHEADGLLPSISSTLPTPPPLARHGPPRTRRIRIPVRALTSYRRFLAFADLTFVSDLRLTQVQQAIDVDPSNAELLALKSELEELIDLTKQAIAASQPPAPTSKAGPSKPSRPAASTSSPHPTAGPSASAPAAAPSTEASPSLPTFKVSDEILAKYTDGVFYPAKIVSMHGPSNQSIYTVQYLGAYSATPQVQLPLAAIKPMTAQKRKQLDEEREDKEKEKKKAKNEKWKEIKTQKNTEQVKKMDSWAKFGQKYVRTQDVETAMWSVDADLELSVRWWCLFLGPRRRGSPFLD